ncbi:hypothetical protein D0866_12034, partial [Hortaea werneckii]
MSQSASPREPEDVEPAPPSPNENEPQQQEDDMNRHNDPGDHGLGYDFEVKEQDRWLPIANACLVFHIYRCVARLVYRLSNQRLNRQPAICSLLFGRIAMPSQSPQSSPSQPSSRSKKSPKTSDNDANIHNFAPVARIMKTALPENAKIAKEAKECMQECVSEFISFITSEASEKCQQEKRKTVNGEDILFAMT